jgi:hypothetical protein
MDAASAIVFTPKEGSGSEYRGLDAWLITFESVLAMRYGPMRDWSGVFHAPRPDDRDVAAWEVKPSSWLDQVAPGFAHGHVDHYVLTYDDAIYEIATRAWRSEPLPASWDLAEEMTHGPPCRTARG